MNTSSEILLKLAAALPAAGILAVASHIQVVPVMALASAVIVYGLLVRRAAASQPATRRQEAEYNQDELRPGKTGRTPTTPGA